MNPDAARALRHGFTLIEILAVLAMIGLIAAMVMPNVDFGGSRLVRAEAQDLAAAIEFARQRAVMTGRTHQVVIEIERGEHWVEWAAPSTPEIEKVNADGETGERTLDFIPPPLDVEEFIPIPGELGRVHAAHEKTAILGVERSGRIDDRGMVELRVSADGVTEPATILLGDDEGDYPMRIEVEPLADAVQVYDGE